VFGNPAYALLSIAAIVLSAIVWDRFFTQRGPRDARLVAVRRLCWSKDRVPGRGGLALAQ